MAAGDEPMTGPQASDRETLAQQAGVEPPTGLNKSEAARASDDSKSVTLTSPENASSTSRAESA